MCRDRASWRPAWLLGLLVFWVGSPGCGAPAGSPAAAAARPIVLPDDWRAIPAESIAVPGDPLSAWEGPKGARLVCYRTMFAPGAKPLSLANELAARLLNEPGLEAPRAEVRHAGQTEVGCVTARVVPGGRQQSTRTRFWACLPKPDGVVWLRWDYPTDSEVELAPTIAKALEGLASTSWGAGPTAPYE